MYVHSKNIVLRENEMGFANFIVSRTKLTWRHDIIKGSLYVLHKIKIAKNI